MKALILEDNLSLAQALKEFLSKEGWQVDISGSWKEASLLINKHFFDLFVIDIVLPDKQGFEVLEILSQNKAHSLSKIALISGFFEESSITKKIPENLKSNCVFFKKPIKENDFLNYLQKIKPKALSESHSIFECFFEQGIPSKPLAFYLPKSKTFDAKELIPVTFLAHLKKFTGNLKITTDNNNESLIKFYNGNIIKLISNSEKSFFGNLLVEHGLSLQEDIQSLLENEEPKKLLGERLVEKELLSPYMLNFILKEQVKIRLSEIMSDSSFRLNIIKKSSEHNETADIDFNEIDFIDWLADSLQTELKSDLLNRFYLETKSKTIQKSTQINKILVYQKKFLQDYNLLFKNLKKDSVVEDVVNCSKNRNYSLQLLYFGFLTKSIYLENKREEAVNLQKIDFLLDSIIEKDSEDLFAMLNLPWNASTEEAEKSYKQLLQKIHPDLIPLNAPKKLKEKCETAFDKITKSYKTLKDEGKRKEYIKVQKDENFIPVMNKYEEGLTKIKQEKYKEGAEALLQIINHKQIPSNTGLYLLWAKLKSSHEDFSENRKKAIQIKQAIDSCPISLRISPLFWYVKGLFCVKTKQYEKAVELFKKSLQIEKNFVEAKKELIFIKNFILKNKKKNIFDLFFKKSC